MSSATSIPNSPLPFGADNASHSAWQRSRSARGSTHRNAEGINQLYEDGPKPSTYPAFIAAAQASDVAQRRASASIAPSSINDVPHRIKKLIKRHKTQLWVLAVMFQLNVVALTIGVTLGATSAHSHGEGATQVAAIILGITSFVGMISSLSLGWLTWNGRQARARLEKKWVYEEEVKETRSLREKDREETARANIRERERSLSRNRSVSRGRRHDSVWVLPSFRELTPSPPPKDSHEANANVPSNPRNGKERMPEPRPTLATINSTNAVAQAESEVGTEKDRGSNYTHHLDLDNSSEEDVPPVPAIDKDKGLERANVSTVPELQASAPTIEAVAAKTSEREPDPALQDRQLEMDVSKSLEEFWTIAPQPQQESSNTIHEPSPPDITVPPTNEHANSSIIQGSSPTLLNSTPISGITPTPTDQELTHLNTALINSFRPTRTPINMTPHEAHFPSPLSTHHPFPSPTSPTSPTTPLGHSLLQSGARPSSVRRAENIMRLGSTAQTETITRLNNGLLGSAQSDNNFLTMIENSGSESGGEDVRAYRRERSGERVDAWAESQGELGEGGRGMGGRADSEGWRGRLGLVGRGRGDAEGGLEMGGGSGAGGKRRSVSVGVVGGSGVGGEERGEGGVAGGEGSVVGTSRPNKKHIAGLMKREGRREGK